MLPDPFDLFAKSVYDTSKEMAMRFARVPGVHIIVRNDKCTGCSKCVRDGFCRFGAISILNRKASINDLRCRGCMRCTHLCPQNALAIEVRPPPVVQETLRQIDNEINSRLKSW